MSWAIHDCGQAACALLAPKDITLQQSVEGTTYGVKLVNGQSCCHYMP